MMMVVVVGVVDDSDDDDDGDGDGDGDDDGDGDGDDDDDEMLMKRKRGRCMRKVITMMVTKRYEQLVATMNPMMGDSRASHMLECKGPHTGQPCV
jgi:hypothetical protein